MPDRFEELLPFVPECPSASVPDTRAAALRTSSRFMKSRYRQILALLANKPLCIFEVAHQLSNDLQTTIHDHQISGRFGALVEGGLIQKSGVTRPTPTGCQAAEYQPTLAGLAVLAEASRENPNHSASNGGAAELSGNGPQATVCESPRPADSV